MTTLVPVDSMPVARSSGLDLEAETAPLSSSRAEAELSSHGLASEGGGTRPTKITSRARAQTLYEGRLDSDSSQTGYVYQIRDESDHVHTDIRSLQMRARVHSGEDIGYCRRFLEALCCLKPEFKHSVQRVHEVGRRDLPFITFLVGTTLLTVLCFAVPIPAACESFMSTEVLQGRPWWPVKDGRWRYYIFLWLQCLVMYLPTPMFGMFLTRVNPEGERGAGTGTGSHSAGQNEDEDDDEDEHKGSFDIVMSDANAENSTPRADTSLEDTTSRTTMEDMEDTISRTTYHEREAVRYRYAGTQGSILQGLIISSIGATVTVIWHPIAATYFWGFPVPFSEVSVGFPAYCLTILITAVCMATGRFMPQGVRKEPWRDKIKDVWFLIILPTVVMMDTVGYLFFATLIQARPENKIYALGFPLIKSGSKILLNFATKSLYERQVPLMSQIQCLCAVFPACILPSVVDPSTFVGLILLDCVVMIMKLKEYWLPICCPQWCDPNRKQIQHMVATRWHRVTKGHSAVGAEDDEDVSVKRELTLLDSIDALQTNVNRHSADTLRKSAGETDHNEVDFKETFEDFTFHVVDDNDKNTVLDQTTNLIKLAMEEFVELVIPIQATVLELFIYYGWAKNVAPSISGESPSEFWVSVTLKMFQAGVQPFIIIFAAYLIGRFTKANFYLVLFYELDRSFVMLMVSCSAMTIFCYSTLLPFYNFNVGLAVTIYHSGNWTMTQYEGLVKNETIFRSHFGC